MPVYFLHVRNHTGFARDDEGAEFPDLEAARKQAVEGIRSILSDEMKQGMLDFRGRIEIATEDDELVDAVPFRAAFEIHMEDDRGA
jgi:hypothetical protein